MPSLTEEIQQGVAAALGAGATGLFAWFRLRRMAASDNKSTAADAATTVVIELLRAEVTRLSDQNSHLAKIVNALQLQVIDLHRENIQMRNEITRLQNASKAG